MSWLYLVAYFGLFYLYLFYQLSNSYLRCYANCAICQTLSLLLGNGIVPSFLNQFPDDSDSSTKLSSLSSSSVSSYSSSEPGDVPNEDLFSSSSESLCGTTTVESSSDSDSDSDIDITNQFLSPSDEEVESVYEYEDDIMLRLRGLPNIHLFSRKALARENSYGRTIPKLAQIDVGEGYYNAL